MSTPPCIIGAVIMKITMSSIITSIKLTTLISAFSGSPSARRRRATLDPPLPNHHGNDLGAEPLELALESVQPVGEDVVPEHGRDGHGERSRSGREGFGHPRRDGAQVPGSLHGDPDEGIDDAEHG